MDFKNLFISMVSYYPSMRLSIGEIALSPWVQSEVPEGEQVFDYMSILREQLKLGNPICAEEEIKATNSDATKTEHHNFDMKDLDKIVDELPDIEDEFEGSHSSFEMEDEEFDLASEEFEQAEKR